MWKVIETEVEKTRMVKQKEKEKTEKGGRNEKKEKTQKGENNGSRKGGRRIEDLE